MEGRSFPKKNPKILGSACVSAEGSVSGEREFNCERVHGASFVYAQYSLKGAGWLNW